MDEHVVMSDDLANKILEEMRLLRSELGSLRANLAGRRESERPRIEPYKVVEFARLIRRSRMWVSNRCMAGLIRTLPGKPYRIPVLELKRWTEGRET